MNNNKEYEFQNSRTDDGQLNEAWMAKPRPLNRLYRILDIVVAKYEIIDLTENYFINVIFL